MVRTHRYPLEAATIASAMPVLPEVGSTMVETPGVSAPAALGVTASRALRLLRHALGECGHGRPGSRLVMSDVAELNPRHDSDGRTARIAARLVYEIAAIR